MSRMTREETETITMINMSEQIVKLAKESLEFANERNELEEKLQVERKELVDTCRTLGRFRDEVSELCAERRKLREDNDVLTDKIFNLKKCNDDLADIVLKLREELKMPSHPGKPRKPRKPKPVKR